MNEAFKYLYTHIGTFGSIPTHKVYISDIENRSKLVFADNSYLYGVISEWALRNSDFDSAEQEWADESTEYINKERIKLEFYKKQHISFVPLLSISS